MAGLAASGGADAAEPEFALTPYLWMAGVTGTLGTAVPVIPAQRVEADFGDVLSNLNAVPVMLAAEFRQGRFGILTDLVAISVETGITPPGPAFSGGEARLRQVIGSALLAWRVVEDGPAALDLGLGLRAFGWVAPVAGLRYRHAFGANWAATFYGDIGGAGGDLTWQALATLDYRMNDSITLRAGYRWLSFERDDGPLRQEMGLGGPLLGATIRF
mgnify:CR=1 FL=1